MASRMVVVEGAGAEIPLPAGAARPSMRPPAMEEPIATARTLIAANADALGLVAPLAAVEAVPMADARTKGGGSGEGGGG